MANLSEKQIEKLLIDACREKMFFCVKSEIIAKGFPDRIVFNDQKKIIMFIEIKNQAQRGRDPMQKFWSKIIKNAGGIYYLIDGEQEMKTFIKEVL